MSLFLLVKGPNPNMRVEKLKAYFGCSFYGRQAPY